MSAARPGLPRIVAVLLASAAAAGPVRADEPPPARGTVVKRPASPEWSKPSSVVDRSQLQDAGADLGEALDEQPGLRVTRLGGLGAFSTASIRGSTADQVGVYLDGIPLGGADGGPVDLSTLPVGPIEAIGIYRGSAPSILGASAIGGVLALRSRGLEGHSLELEALGGSFDTRGARVFYGFGDDRWGLGIAVDYLGSEGDFAYTSDGGTAWDSSDDVQRTRRNNAFDQLSVMLKSRLQLTDEVRLTLLDLVSWHERGLAGLALFDTEALSASAVRNVAGARLEAGPDDTRVAAAAWVAYGRSALDDPLRELPGGAGSSDDRSLTPGGSLSLRLVRELSEDLVLTPVASLGYRFERYVPYRDAGPAQGVPPSERHLASAAGEVALHVVPADLELFLSGRYEGAWGSVVDDRVVGDPVSASPEAHGGSGRFGLAWRAHPTTTLTLGAARALRVPTLFELFGDTGYALGNPRLRPEIGHTLDLGLRHDADWLGEGHYLVLELGGFVMWSEDLIQYVQNASGVSRPENVDAARVAGLELGLFADLASHVRVRASLTLMDARNTSEIAAREGNQLPFRPALQAYARLELYHAFGGCLTDAGLHVEVEGVEGNHLDHANLVELPGRLLVGAGAWARVSDQLRLDLTLRNLTDQRVVDLAGYPLPGLTAMASLRWTPPLEAP